MPTRSVQEAAEVKRLFAALADITRIRILNLLTAGELCVCDIVDLLSLPQSTASRHLTILREEGLVEVDRRGRFAYYRLPDERPEWERQVLGGVRETLGLGPGLAEERVLARDRAASRRTDPCEETEPAEAPCATR